MAADFDYKAKIKSLKAKKINNKNYLAVSTFSNQGFFIDVDTGHKTSIKHKENFNAVV